MDDKRRIIIAAAAKVMEQQGSNFTIEHVAQVAGIAKGTIYLYFSSKKELVVQVLLAGIDQLEQRLKEADTGHSYQDRLRAMISAHFYHVANRTPLIQRIMISEPEILRNIEQDFVPRVLRLQSIYVNILNQGLEAGEFRPHDTQIIAASLLAMIHNLAASCNMFGQEIPPEKALSEVLDMVLQGIRAKNKEAFKNLLDPQEGDKSCKV